MLANATTGDACKPPGPKSATKYKNKSAIDNSDYEVVLNWSKKALTNTHLAV